MEDVQLQHDGARPRIDLAVPAMWPVDEPQAWLTALRATGPPRDEAVASLYELLARAARSEISRRWADLGLGDDDEVDELAAQAADDALLAVLSQLDNPRGDSRFTTWACKFAILEAGIRARRRAWQRRDVDLNPESWKRLAAPAERADDVPGHAELLATLAIAIDAELTRHERCVLVALSVDQVPIDVLAERLNTTRGALYETLHDARRRLRQVLDDRGLTFDQA